MSKPVLLIADHLVAPTGVAQQVKILGLSLLERGYTPFCLGADPRFANHGPHAAALSTTGWRTLSPDEGFAAARSGALVSFATPSFGDPMSVLTMVQKIKQTYDVETLHVVIISDPRLYASFWPHTRIFREAGCKITYWHVWDNGPSPEYNNYLEDCCDTIACISEQTLDGLRGVVSDEKLVYVPHSLPPAGPFLPLGFTQQQVEQVRLQMLGSTFRGRLLLLWDNKNFWRKLPGHLLFGLAEAKKRGAPVTLLMKTNVFPFGSEAGQDLVEICHKLDLEIGRDVVFVDKEMNEGSINVIYNIADAVINVAHSEGFGLSTLCAMMTGKPIIALATGGLRAQLGFASLEADPESAQKRGCEAVPHGVAIWPANRHLNGGPHAAYIWEEHSSIDDIASAIEMMVERSTPELYPEMCTAAREFALEHFAHDKTMASFVSILSDDSRTLQPSCRFVDPAA